MSVFKRGEFYHYEFSFDGKRYQKATGMTNKKAAETVEDLKKESLRRMAVGLPAPLELSVIPTLSEYVPKFLAWSRKVHRKPTTALHRVNCAVLERFFGEKSLGQISRGDVTDFMVARSQEPRTNVVGEIAPTGEFVLPPNPHSRSYRAELKRYQRATLGRPRQVRIVEGTIGEVSVNRALTTLRLLYGLAQGKYPQLQNPARGGRGGVQRLPETEVQRIVQDDEFQRYLKFAPPDLRDIAQIIRERGPRPQDVCSLKIQQCDFEARNGKGTVEFWPKPKPRTGIVGVVVPTKGKNKNSSRVVVMSPVVRKILQERIAEARELGTEFLFPMKNYHGHVVKIVPGRPRTPNSLTKPHNLAIRKAGIKDRVRLYDLRHTFATMAVRKGAHLRVIQDMLGHSDPRLTQRYTQKNDLVAQEHYFESIDGA